MVAEEHQVLLRRCVERVWNSQDFDAIGEFHAAAFTHNGTPTTVAAMQQGVRDWLTNAYPDLAHTIDDSIAEGDTVAFRWTMRGTNWETGTQQVVRGNTFMRMVGGTIVEDWFTSVPVHEQSVG